MKIDAFELACTYATWRMGDAWGYMCLFIGLPLLLLALLYSMIDGYYEAVEAGAPTRVFWCGAKLPQTLFVSASYCSTVTDAELTEYEEKVHALRWDKYCAEIVKGNKDKGDVSNCHFHGYHDMSRPRAETLGVPTIVEPEAEQETPRIFNASQREDGLPGLNDGKRFVTGSNQSLEQFQDRIGSLWECAYDGLSVAVQDLDETVAKIDAASSPLALPVCNGHFEYAAFMDNSGGTWRCVSPEEEADTTEVSPTAPLLPNPWEARQGGG